MRRLGLLLAAVVILLAAGVAHGLRTDRWGGTADTAAAAARVAGVPDRVGDWEAAAVDINPRELALSRAAGIVARRYTNRYTRSAVTVMVVTGRPGPVAVHTPDVCFSGAGFVPGPTEVRTLPDGAKGWTALFTKPGPTPETLRVTWAWSDGGDWVAEGSPRTAFAGVRVLHKLYVVRPAGVGDDAAADAAEVEFLRAFLPALRARLNPA